MATSRGLHANKNAAMPELMELQDFVTWKYNQTPATPLFHLVQYIPMIM